MYIKPFGVEEWMNDHETWCKYNLGETCVCPLSLKELEALGDFKIEDLPIRFTYGDITGSPKLKDAIIDFYKDKGAQDLDDNNLTITHGGSGANYLIYAALADKESEFIVLTPTYQQHQSIPEAHGAVIHEVSLLDDDYLEHVSALVNKHTKAISLTNPCNPLGTVLTQEEMQKLVAIAQKNNSYIIADEVYLGLAPKTPSFLALYDKTISTFSLSKSFSLAGLRLGAVVGPKEVIKAINSYRDYSLISCSPLDDTLAMMALNNRKALIDRNLSIAQDNRDYLLKSIKNSKNLYFKKEPTDGSICLVSYKFAMDSAEFCEKIQKECGILLVPGCCFGVEHSFRIGYGFLKDELKQGLDILVEYTNKL